MQKNNFQTAKNDRHQLARDLDFLVRDQLMSDLLDPDSELGDIMNNATPKKSEAVMSVQPLIPLKTVIAGAIFVMLISGITALAVASTFYAIVMR